MPFKDPEERRAYGREWIKRNAQKARDAMRRWRQRHPGEHAAQTRSYYARNKEKHKAYMAAYLLAHPEVARAKWQNYRARKLLAPGSFTSEEWRSLVELYQGRCAYCGEELPLVVEHRIPVSRGGTNYIENILPACQRCNAKKHRQTDEEFRRRLGIGPLTT